MGPIGIASDWLAPQHLAPEASTSGAETGPALWPRAYPPRRWGRREPWSHGRKQLDVQRASVRRRLARPAGKPRFRPSLQAITW
jgi:hypothetical protein